MKKQISEKVESDEENSDVDSEENSEEGSENGYDSMIDNGTSDDDDDSEEEVEEAPLKKPKLSAKVKNTEKLSRKKVQQEDRKGKHKKAKNDLAKPPTLQEINQLNETQNLFHSNLFRFQIDEMLNEIKVTNKFYKAIDSWLERFNEMLSSIKSGKKSVDFEKAINKMTKTGVVYPLKTASWREYPRKEFNFQFFKPAKAYLIGSARAKAMIGPELIADIGVDIPQETFGQKINEDHLNGNYHQKRALYLCHLFNEIQNESDLISKVEFDYLLNDELYPVLVISPVGEKVENRCRFRLIVSCDDDSFKFSRFIPSANNVKVVRGQNGAVPTPTPFYNSAILQNMRQKQNEEFIEDQLQDRQNYRDGIRLLKIWLKQRGLETNGLGMSGFTLNMFVCYLIQSKKLFPTMSSYQVVRTVWNHLANSKWETKGITMWKPPFQPTPPPIEDFHQHFDVVFLDPTGFFNIAYNFNLALYKRIRNESQQAIALLNNVASGGNAFSCLFMTKMPFFQQFDHIISIKMSEIQEATADRPLNYFEYKIPSAVEKIAAPLHTGLGERVISITPFVTETTINFGLILNPNEAFNIIIKGPPANEPTSNAFRAFWGKHSTLRRFQDGSITEAVVVCPGDADLPTKRLIMKRITEIIFEQHLADIKYAYIANQIDDDESSSESTSLSAIQTFDEIGKTIRLMDDLPLSITSVQGISPVFRYTDPKAMGKARVAGNTFIARTLYYGKLQLTSSGKWPNDLEAMRRIKAAFYVKIAENLRRNNFSHARPHCDGVDVLKNGFVFRLSLTHPKELALVKQVTNGNVLKKYRDNAESIEMEKESLLLPKVTSYLHGIYLSSPAFGPTCCLAKKWLSYHFIDTQLFPDECIELLVASLFIRPEPFQQPQQPQLGFLRFLALLSTRDWTNEIVFINFNNDLTEDDITEAEKKFQEDRSAFPPLCLITSCDGEKTSVWSKAAPSVQVLTRVVLLARHNLTLVESNLLRGGKISALFRDTTVGYDFAIHLKTDFADSTMAGADYTELYLMELRSAYSDVALFFFNHFVRDKILVLLRPDYLEEKEFKTSQVTCRNWNTATEKLAPNVKRVLKDFEIVGQGLVRRIENLKVTK